MLEKTSHTPPYIVVFKLLSGEEIIVTVKNILSTAYEIKNPLMMVMGQRGPQFAPFMIMDNPTKSITLYKSSIMAGVLPTPELESQYESIVSGIALPQKSSIIT